MANTTLRQVRAITERRAAPRVYCTEFAPLRLADGTPLYLEWIIEDTDGTLYRVPAEPDGWLHKSPFEGQADRLKPLPAGEADLIVKLTRADSGNPPARGRLLEHYYLQAP